GGGQRLPAGHQLEAQPDDFPDVDLIVDDQDAPAGHASRPRYDVRPRAGIPPPASLLRREAGTNGRATDRIITKTSGSSDRQDLTFPAGRVATLTPTFPLRQNS